MAIFHGLEIGRNLTSVHHTGVLSLLMVVPEREAPVNAICEGSGNAQCLDVLRAPSKGAGVLDVLFAELGSVTAMSV